MNKIVPNTVDVRVDHQRVNESKDQHYPERCMRVKEEQPQKICEVQKAGQRGNGVPACVREEL